ncbi:Oidioi.mRNA.OKI2018_I69.chr2.g5786.t1.cds [Oikopleura dioica]|uniref:Oidioi.mRNA.OKI2018_I69.chr2.g5786.t1.cds n=1 Tax=Oikopleura dioica TaxID=34765 RepID=A0ABN7T7Y1_OIKDI|nr:Oidioi.mRNA.OKI2018_I69.chr2.g5786.t1.cds [Oikopleura dioica]
MKFYLREIKNKVFLEARFQSFLALSVVSAHWLRPIKREPKKQDFNIDEFIQQLDMQLGQLDKQQSKNQEHLTLNTLF